VGAGGVYLVAMILRLVRSGLTSAEVIGQGFAGLPSAPAAGVALCLVALEAAPPVTCALVLVLAVLIVGNYHYPRQRAALMPIIAGGPAVGLLGVWGVLPLRPAVIASMIAVMSLPVASAAAAWRRRQRLAAPDDARR
jgi:phosphatidylserine synthase